MNTDIRTRLVDSMWEALRQHLESRRRPVEDEIRRYPAPIAGCDAHFNYLLEQRAALSRELVRLDAASQAAASEAEPRQSVEAFLRSSTCIDANAAAEIRAGSTRPVR